MRRLKVLLTASNVETALSMVGFAASSAFWLALAFLMSAQAYGVLMTVQAGVLLIVAALTFRTHDLFFNLLRTKKQAARAAFRMTRASENAAGLLCVAIVAALAGTALLPGSEQKGAFAIVVGFGILAVMGANQGSAIAMLREHRRGDIIARTDAVTAACWLLAGLAVFALRNAHPLIALPIGAVPQAVRSLLLVRAAALLDTSAAAVGTRSQWKAAAGFLAGAQITNFLKNGAVSIETVILATIAPAPVVAVYRVARAVLGISAAGLNVAYQRSYPLLAHSSSKAECQTILRALDQRSLRICFLTYPLSVAVTLAYAWLKPDVGMLVLQLLTLGTSLAFLPAALQQSAFAVLSLRADHRGVTAGYILWFAALLPFLGILWAMPRVELFVGALIFAGFARLWFLKRRANHVLRQLSADHSTQGEQTS